MSIQVEVLSPPIKFLTCINCIIFCNKKREARHSCRTNSTGGCMRGDTSTRSYQITKCTCQWRTAHMGVSQANASK